MSTIDESSLEPTRLGPAKALRKRLIKEASAESLKNFMDFVALAPGRILDVTIAEEHLGNLEVKEIKAFSGQTGKETEVTGRLTIPQCKAFPNGLLVEDFSLIRVFPNKDIPCKDELFLSYCLVNPDRDINPALLQYVKLSIPKKEATQEASSVTTQTPRTLAGQTRIKTDEEDRVNFMAVLERRIKDRQEMSARLIRGTLPIGTELKIYAVKILQSGAALKKCIGVMKIEEIAAATGFSSERGEELYGNIKGMPNRFILITDNIDFVAEGHLATEITCSAEVGERGQPGEPCMMIFTKDALRCKGPLDPNKILQPGPRITGDEDLNAIIFLREQTQDRILEFEIIEKPASGSAPNINQT